MPLFVSPKNQFALFRAIFDEAEVAHGDFTQNKRL
jgi:hypothetical protein